MNIEEQKKLLAMKNTIRSQLREGDQPWEGRLWEICRTMNKNLMRGRHGATRWHKQATDRSAEDFSSFCHSAQEVNAAVVLGIIVQLPGEW
jgi:hypothetical protein